jgi:hypothetical protein
MSIEIKEVKTKRDLKTFIYLPEKIHEGQSNWLHPIYMDEWKLFSPKENSQFQHNDTILLLAMNGNETVGRIMGIIPHHYNQKNNLLSARFAFFECYKDSNVFDVLIKYIEKWAKERNCNEVVGPMGFSDKEPQGFVIKGFNSETMLQTNCTFPFMVDFIEANGYIPHVDLCQYELPIIEGMTERYKIFAKRVESKNSIVIQEFNTTRAVRPFIVPVFNLINKTYQDIYGFSPLTDKEAKEFSFRFLPLLDPRLIKVITDKDNEVLAFIVSMPDLSKGIKRARGRILPFGWFHILRAGKKSKRLVLVLGAISEEARNRGLDAVLAHRLLTSALQRGFTTIDSHLIMKENHKMRQEIERNENYRLYKEYRIFRKEI